MSIRGVASVDVEPRVKLSWWRAVKLPDGSIHLCGSTGFVTGGRVSSAVQSFDYGAATATTQSGRVYELVGPPGVDGDAYYTLNHWVLFHGITEWTEVSEEIWAEIKARITN